ncbi:uncharacterized protein LOC120085458 [Benincasa hispida]|uniref:uncharacterized protein LOC120085458 n=1 Tax=Benincasa hispida TaxID=102211 RepID=UPI00190115A0|nr:uncharacterized protein LOC120085458 [Benincasa hispida]
MKDQTITKQPKFSCSSIEEEDDWQNETVNDVPMRGTRLLSDVYERCNVALYEPADYAEAKKDQMWMVSMDEEMSMIEKNKTWILVDRPQGKKIRHNQVTARNSCTKGLESLPVGCQISFFKWCPTGINLC